MSYIAALADRDSESMQGTVRPHRLKWAMKSAVRESEQRAADGSTMTQRLAAAAALALIEGAGINDANDTGRIFKAHPDSIPVKGGHFEHNGLLVEAACRLAEKIALDQATPNPNKAQGIAARSHLRELLGGSVDNLERGQPADQWWDESFAAITQMLGRYAAPASTYPSLREYDPQPGPETKTLAPRDAAVQLSKGSADSTAVGGEQDSPHPRGRATEEIPGDESVVVGVSRWSNVSARLVGTRIRVAVMVAVVTIAAFIALAEAVAPIPRFLFGWQDTYVDSYPIPSLPPPVEGVASPLTLPNTSVQLFFMDQGSEQAATDQTVNGRLPVATAAVMPLQYQIATFQVLLSKTHADADPDTNLKLWIQAPLPMDITGATLMKTPVKESIPQPELNTVNGNGGKAVDVPSLDGGDVLYQFQVVARPDRTNNGYFCGYNAKFVQVMVRSEDKTATSQDGVVTPYPLYVPRGEGC